MCKRSLSQKPADLILACRSHPLIDTFTCDLVGLRAMPPFLQHLTQLKRLSLAFNQITAWVKLLPDELLDLALLGNEQLQRIPTGSLPAKGALNLAWQVLSEPGLPYSTCVHSSVGWVCLCSTSTQPTSPTVPTDCELLCPKLTVDQQTYPAAVVGTVVNTSCSPAELPFQELTCQFDAASQLGRWQGRLLTPTRLPFVHQCASGLVVNMVVPTMGSTIDSPLPLPVTRVYFTHCASAAALSGLQALLRQHANTVTELVVRDCGLSSSSMRPLLSTLLPNLRLLDLTHNAIEVIPERTFLPYRTRKLQRLDLSHNAITDLPRSFVSSENFFTQLNLSHNRVTALFELSLPDNKAVVSLDLSSNDIRVLRGDRFFNAFNSSKLGNANLLMTSNPSQCAFYELPTGYWTLHCNCSSGLRNAPGCPASFSCNATALPAGLATSNKTSVLLDPIQVCDGYNDCPGDSDEIHCNGVGVVQQTLCSALVDTCNQACYRAIEIESSNGQMVVVPAPTRCPVQGRLCQKMVLSSDSVQTAVGLMGAVHVTAGWGNGTLKHVPSCYFNCLDLSQVLL